MTTRPDIEELVLEYKKNSSDELLNDIIVNIEPLVRYWCNSQCYLPWEKEDLLQVARMAVVGALERFDPEKGIRFKTFAYKTVSGKILNYYRDHTWRITIPRKYRELSTYIKRKEHDLYQKTGTKPDLKEIADKLDLKEEEVKEVLKAKEAAKTSSLSQHLENDDNDGVNLSFFIGKEDDNLQNIEKKQDLIKAMDSLEENKKEVLYLRFYKDLTQTNVADILGVSQMQISRLERMALKELRSILKN